MDWKIAGAFAFGLILGWNVYSVNRYRRGDISFGDLATLMGVVGGAAVLSLFPNNTDLFGAYGVGLGTGFFAYFPVLLGMVKVSANFDSDWFLDGRRTNPAEGSGYGADDVRPTLSPMGFDPTRAPLPAPTAAVTINFHGTNPGDAAALQPTALLETLSAPSPNAMRVQQTCVAVWSRSGPMGPFKDTSPGYVTEVAHQLGLDLSGSADQILDTLLNSAEWQVLSDGNAAQEAAIQGKFVVAGVTGLNRRI